MKELKRQIYLKKCLKGKNNKNKKTKGKKVSTKKDLKKEKDIFEE